MSVASMHEVRLESDELEIVMELLKREARGLPVEIHHTYSKEYREQLRSRLKLVEELLERLRRV